MRTTLPRRISFGRMKDSVVWIEKTRGKAKNKTPRKKRDMFSR
jgi:hypothetical protein